MTMARAISQRGYGFKAYGVSVLGYVESSRLDGDGPAPADPVKRPIRGVGGNHLVFPGLSRI